MLKLIIIDLDDTIINYTEANHIAFNLLIQTICNLYNKNYNYVLETHKNIKNKLYKIYENQCYRHDKLLQLKLLCNELSINDMNTIYKLYKLYETTYLNNIKLHDKCIDFLELCKNKNIKICIMTNNLLSIQLKVCDKFNLNKYIDMMFTSNEFIYEKPNKEPLDYILNYYNVTNDNVIIIGDSLESDIKWGTDNNIKTILCDNKTPNTSFDNCISCISLI